MEKEIPHFEDAFFEGRKVLDLTTGKLREIKRIPKNETIFTYFIKGKYNPSKHITLRVARLNPVRYKILTYKEEEAVLEWCSHSKEERIRIFSEKRDSIMDVTLRQLELLYNISF